MLSNEHVLKDDSISFFLFKKRTASEVYTKVQLPIVGRRGHLKTIHHASFSFLSSFNSFFTIYLKLTRIGRV